MILDRAVRLPARPLHGSAWSHDDRTQDHAGGDEFSRPGAHLGRDRIEFRESPGLALVYDTPSVALPWLVPGAGG